LCPTVCDPMVYMIHGVLQARTLEWVAITLFAVNNIALYT